MENEQKIEKPDISLDVPVLTPTVKAAGYGLNTS